jgi:hypothetical protein
VPDVDNPIVACPACGGPLSAERESWVCEVGHRYSFIDLADDQAAACARTLWYALRSLEDRAISSRFAAARFEEDGRRRQADLLLTQSIDDLAMVDRLHVLLRDLNGDDRPATAHPAPVSHEEPPGQGSHS